MNIQSVETTAIKPAPWMATYILSPDFRLLRSSVTDFGILSPLLVQLSTSHIIDGFVRWVIADTDRTYRAKRGTLVPVHFIDCDDATAMTLHVQLNRGRGFLAAKNLSGLIENMISAGVPEDKIGSLLGMADDEFDMIRNPQLLKLKKAQEHTYSRAWVPVEQPAGIATTVLPPDLEKPPNGDR
jgi:hypothetical protein